MWREASSLIAVIFKTWLLLLARISPQKCIAIQKIISLRHSPQDLNYGRRYVHKVCVAQNCIFSFEYHSSCWLHRVIVHGISSEEKKTLFSITFKISLGTSICDADWSSKERLLNCRCFWYSVLIFWISE